MPSRAYEPNRVNLRAIGWFAGALLALGALLHIGLWWLLNAWAGSAITPFEQHAPRAGSERVPPEPRLQVHPPADLASLRATEEAILNSYGWIDRQAGIIRVPIDRAIDLLAGRHAQGRPGSTSTEASP